MVVRAHVEKNTYADSVRLMQVGRLLREQPGIADAGVVMGTPANLASLAEAALLAETAAAAGPNDLVLAVRATEVAAAEAALHSAMAALHQHAPGPTHEAPAHSLRGAVARAPAVNLALISVPGHLAAIEAAEALRVGLHVFLFSDNVTLDDEVSLKRLADECGLLLLGPDCGTAILGGVPLGFANVVRSGPVGIVGASGTGIQQVACLLDAAGVGLSHAIGTGGRDLHEAVGARTTLRALALLADDPATQVIVLVSKPPSPAVARAVLAAAAATGKPIVAALLGASPDDVPPGVTWARSLAEAADAAAALVGGQPRGPAPLPERPAAVGGALCGLFSGGTLAYEALLVARERLGSVASNVDGFTDRDTPHRIVDLGSDEYTAGRPHPMIDFATRLEQLEAAAHDPAVGVVLLDVVLGTGAHPDPQNELAPAIGRARATAARRPLAVVVSLCGAEGDPQGLARQRGALQDAGALVYTRNIDAAAAAAHLAGPLAELENLP